MWGGTTAADLKIAGSTTTTSIASGSLKLSSINEATSLSTYSTAGVSVPTGSFRINDSSGSQFVVTVSSTTKTVGDVLSAINQATGGQVTAQLSRSGDGIELVDQAAGVAPFPSRKSPEKLQRNSICWGVEWLAVMGNR